MDKIVDSLYLGDIQGASNLFTLKRMGITHILQVAGGFQPFFPGQFKYKVVNVLDMPYENLGKYFNSCISFMKQAIANGGSVLVHCYAGVSRSASVVIAYLMQEMGLAMIPAMQFVRQRRPIIYPNPGFQKQLQDFERTLKLKISGAAKKDLGQVSPSKNTTGTEKIPQFHPPSTNHPEAKRPMDQKPLSKSADKNHKPNCNKTQYEDNAIFKPTDKTTELQQLYGRTNLMANSLQPKGRAQSSSAGYRKPQHQATSKNEILKLSNQNLVNAASSTNQKHQSSRAKSSHGSKKIHELYNYERNTLDNLINSQQEMIRSLDPYLQQSQGQAKQATYNSSSLRASNTVDGNSLYNSIPKGGKHNQGESSPYPDFRTDKNIQINESTHNLQYSCGLCSVPLFSSKDICDHNTSLMTSSQRGKATMNQHHQHKFSVNSQQIFGKTQSELNSGGYYQGNGCASVFIKRQEWINEQDGSSGTILCPRKTCAVKIGSYCWQGARCNSCGQLVSPSFQIFRNRINQRQAESVSNPYSYQQEQKQKNLYSLYNPLAQSQEHAKTYHGSFNQTKDIKKQIPDNNFKNHENDKSYKNHNLSYQDIYNQQIKEEKRQSSTIDDLLRLRRDQKDILSTSHQNANYQQKQQQSQIVQNANNNSTIQKSQKVISNEKALAFPSSQYHQHKTHQKHNSNSMNHQYMNNIYQQLVMEQQNKRLLGNPQQPAGLASPQVKHHKKY